MKSAECHHLSSEIILIVEYRHTAAPPLLLLSPAHAVMEKNREATVTGE
jgi:hypothetical protein